MPQPKQHLCRSECPARDRPNNMCTYGKRELPLPGIGQTCFYQAAMQFRYANVDYIEIAKHKWKLNQEPPKVQRLLKIVSDTLDLP